MENTNTKNLPSRFTAMMPTHHELKEDKPIEIVYHLMKAYNLLREKEEALGAIQQDETSKKILKTIQRQIHDLAYMIDDTIPGSLPDEVYAEIKNLVSKRETLHCECDKLTRRIAELSGE